MKLFHGLVVVFLAANVVASSDYHLFLDQYGKIYDAQREVIFYKNLALIKEHNIDENQTYKLAVNQFADLTFDEFQQAHAAANIPVHNCPSCESSENDSLPDNVDWRDHGAVTPVKNQGHCGSCWTFSATGAMEGFLKLKTGRLQSLSEQQIVDCDTQGDGCQGGFARYGFEYAAKNGIQLEQCYPYTGSDGTCSLNNTNGCTVYGVTGYNSVDSSTAALKLALNKQPVSVAIYAAGTSFQFYSSGVYNDPKCYKARDQLDHAVLAVGYTPEAWIVKNSWGQSWGDQGYIYMARGDDMNTCGILDQPTYPH